MTVAVMVKVFDGLVLATDSASTMRLPDGSHQVYNNANKIFHLHRDLPIGAMTWGLGNLGAASISTVAKDLRMRLMGMDLAHSDWKLDPATYTIEQVAERLIEHFYDELFVPEFGSMPFPPGVITLGMLVCGYGAGNSHPEAYVVLIDVGPRPSPQMVAAQDTFGWETWAQPEASYRLFNGFGQGVPARVRAALDDAEWAKVESIFDLTTVPTPAERAMPLADAIDLAKFMAEVTAGYSHYTLGPDTVGGPIEVSSLSRHEGFKWVSRKHYFTATLNPKEH